MNSLLWLQCIFCFSVQGCMYSCLARAQEKECNCTEGKFRTVSGICSETSDGNAMFLFRFTMGLNKRWGSRDCTMSRALASNKCGPGSISFPSYPYVDWVCCFFSLCPEGFSPCFRFYSLHRKPGQKLTSPILNSTRVEDLHKHQIRLM